MRYSYVRREKAVRIVFHQQFFNSILHSATIGAPLRVTPGCQMSAHWLVGNYPGRRPPDWDNWNEMFNPGWQSQPSAFLKLWNMKKKVRWNPFSIIHHELRQWPAYREGTLCRHQRQRWTHSLHQAHRLRRQTLQLLHLCRYEQRGNKETGTQTESKIPESPPIHKRLHVWLGRDCKPHHTASVWML